MQVYHIHLRKGRQMIPLSHRLWIAKNDSFDMLKIYPVQINFHYLLLAFLVPIGYIRNIIEAFRYLVYAILIFYNYLSTPNYDGYYTIF
jgi:hypothetical protein